MSMASPRQSYEHIPVVSAHALCDALTALQRRPPTPDDDVNLPKFAAHHRNCFLEICSSAHIYNSVRDLISEASYWAKEEAHFEVVFGMVQDYNNGKKSNELACPPLAWLRDVWIRRQRNMKLAMQGTQRTWPCALWRLIGRRNTAIQPLFASSSSFTRCEASAASSPAPAATYDAQ